ASSGLLESTLSLVRGRNSQKLVVNLEICPCRAVPGEVRCHSIPDQRVPLWLLRKHAESSIDSYPQGRAIVGAKQKTSPSLRHGVKLLNAVLKTSGGPHNRDRAVLETVDLIQPAGFIARGHQEHVSPRFDSVRQDLIKA